MKEVIFSVESITMKNRIKTNFFYDLFNTQFSKQNKEFFQIGILSVRLHTLFKKKKLKTIKNKFHKKFDCFDGSKLKAKKNQCFLVFALDEAAQFILSCDPEITYYKKICVGYNNNLPWG